jgi:hypothetical protein
VEIWGIRERAGKEGKRPLGRHRCRCEDITMDLNVVGIDIVHWICVTYVWYNWRPLGNAVMSCGLCELWEMS